MTVCAVVFDYLDHCEEGDGSAAQLGCAEDDVEAALFGEDAVKIGITPLAGNVVGISGHAAFAGARLDRRAKRSVLPA